MIVNIKRNTEIAEKRRVRQERSDVAGSDVALKVTSGVVESGWGGRT